ncbi:glycosyltransferase [Denitrobacterium detoxificans]|uniref:Glycosyl transferase family 2 n=1 Tax=Denitrobacterium detoxificans TaxID=79604 RepID=A0A1H8SLG1_9ACTN|nr:glycosyltransferase [Denitrobacterium detoxificans]SEO79471.1 Glycosyl transferase family 2 [Denitrobacterium detoxificans]
MSILSRLYNRLFAGESWISAAEVRTGAGTRVMGCRPLEEGTWMLESRALVAQDRMDDLQFQVVLDDGTVLDSALRGSQRIASPRGNSKVAWYELCYVTLLSKEMGNVTVRFQSASSGEALCAWTMSQQRWQRELTDDYYALVRNPFADGSYEEWRERQCVTDDQLQRQRESHFPYEPLVSLVSPLYRTPPAFLRVMIDSVRAQSYQKWELVLVNASPDDEALAEVLASYDDERIIVVDHPENDGIDGNTNCGIAASHGDYVGFLDHDDFIEPDLLYEYVARINETQDVDLLYCDEDSFEEGKGYTLPLFKPDRSPDLLYSNNYVIHLLMVSRWLLDRTERSGPLTNGAQDYDLTLKAFEVGRSIVHVPRVLYHWRMHSGSTNGGNSDAKPYCNDAGAYTIEQHFKRRGITADVVDTDCIFVYQLKIHSDIATSSVSAVFDSDESLESGSWDAAVADGLATVTPSESLESERDILAYRNESARKASSEYVLFAAGDVAPITSDALSVLLPYFERSEVGLISPRLLTPQDTLCQSGIVVRADGQLTELGIDLPAWDSGYIGRFHRPANYAAVAPDCVIMRRKDFLEAGGYDESYGSLLYAQVDLCLRLAQKGLLTLYVPFAELRHSRTRFEALSPLHPSVRDLLAHDAKRLAEAWPAIVSSPDGFYNANLDQSSSYYLLDHTK